MADTPSPILLGWREWVYLPDLLSSCMRAKIDTGARTSSLHVKKQWRFTEQGAPWVGFSFRPRRKSKRIIKASAPLIDERMVSDSGGHRSLRPFIATHLSLANETRLVEINLADRQNMLFPLLVGRGALDGFSVDPTRSFLGHQITLKGRK